MGLTERGEREARALGEALAGYRFAAVWASPLRRALDTCRIAGFGDVAERVDDLVEWDYGAYEGRRTADIRREVPGWTLWRDGVPGGETAADVGRRADRVLQRAAELAGEVAIFAHGHFLRVLGARWVGLPPESGERLALATASIGALGTERESRVIAHWNEVCHLPEVDGVAERSERR